MFNKTLSFFLISFFLYFGLSITLDFYLHIRLLSTSFFIILIPTIIINLFFLNNINKFDKKNILLLIFITYILIIFCRIVFFNQESKTIFTNYYIIYIPILICILRQFQFTEKKINYIYVIIFFLLFINILNSFFKLSGFPNIDVADYNADDYAEDSRFRGMFGGANALAYIIILLYYLTIKFWDKWGKLFFIFFSSLIFITILPTLSRTGFVLFFIVFIFGLLRNKILTTIFIIFFIVLFYILLSSNFIFLSDNLKIIDEVIIRFNELGDENSRNDRNLLTITTIFSKIEYIILGLPAAKQIFRDDMAVSDNSFTLILANFGLPFFIFYFYSIIHLLKIFSGINKIKFIYIIILLITFYLNNALFSLNYMFFVILGYFLLHNMYTIKLLNE